MTRAFSYNLTNSVFIDPFGSTTNETGISTIVSTSSTDMTSDRYTLSNIIAKTTQSLTDIAHRIWSFLAMTYAEDAGAAAGAAAGATARATARMRTTRHVYLFPLQ
jgi:hypothetical protein